MCVYVSTQPKGRVPTSSPPPLPGFRHLQGVKGWWEQSWRESESQSPAPRPQPLLCTAGLAVAEMTREPSSAVVGQRGPRRTHGSVLRQLLQGFSRSLTGWACALASRGRLCVSSARGLSDRSKRVSDGGHCPSVTGVRGGDPSLVLPCLDLCHVPFCGLEPASLKGCCWFTVWG